MRLLSVTLYNLGVLIIGATPIEFLPGKNRIRETGTVLYEISPWSGESGDFVKNSPFFGSTFIFNHWYWTWTTENASELIFIRGRSNEKVSTYQQIKQATANQVSSKPTRQMTFDLEYSDDVLSSRNVLHMEMKMKKKRSKSSRKIRNVNISDSSSGMDCYPYDYDQFRREYFDLNWDRRNDSRMEPGKPKKSLTYSCRPDDWRDGVGPITLYCTLHRGLQQGFTKPVISRLAQLIKFWLIAYLAAGGSLWIICGWCCCCLKCKMFKPEEIRQEVRSYILQNPPGVLRDKMHGEKICYKPTREELEAYDELEIKAYAYV